MKKKFAIIVTILIAIIILALLVKGIFFKNSKEEINDYTQYADNEVFYTQATDIITELKNDYKLKNVDEKNSIYFKFIDENLQTIKQATIELYDQEGYLITELHTNEQGEIAINNLENDMTYYYLQTKTSEGLVVDEQLYKLKITQDKNNWTIIIVNADRKLSEEEMQKIIDRYKESVDNKAVNTNNELLSDNEKTEQEMALTTDEQIYLLLKDELRGLQLKVTSTERDLELENNKKAKGYTLRITNAYIMEYEVQPKDNEITILNSKKETTNKFYNGEEFYINKNSYGYVGYDVTIKFKYNDKIYKIKREIVLGEIGSALGAAHGRIELLLQNENGEIIVGERISLCNVISGSTNVIEYLVAKTGKDGVIDYYDVPEGKYVLKRLVNNEEISTEVFEVKRGELVEVKF